jgi:hypothetical protein
MSGKEATMDKAFIEVETREEAEDRAPWAAEIIEAEGGFWAFRYAHDADKWKAQQ